MNELKDTMELETVENDFSEFDLFNEIDIPMEEQSEIEDLITEEELEDVNVLGTDESSENEYLKFENELYYKSDNLVEEQFDEIQDLNREELKDTVNDKVEDLKTENVQYELINEEPIDSYLLIRDVLDQNTKKQHLPSEDRFDIIEGEGRNATFRLKDDSTIVVYDKGIKDNIVEVTGKEFNEHMQALYGSSALKYENGEPNFGEYCQAMTKEELSNFLEKPVENDFSGVGAFEKTKDSTERLGKNGTLNEAYEQIANLMGNVTSAEVKEYLNHNNLVVHESRDGFLIIPSEVHNCFRHTGAIGIKRDLTKFREKIYNISGSNHLILEKRKLQS